MIKFVVEIKAPFGLKDKENPVFKSAKDQPHYYAQMQIEMFCCEAEKCYFFQWAPKGSKLEIVHRDQEWLHQNIPKLHEFYLEYLEEINNPDEYMEPLIAELPHSIYCEEYRLAKEAMEDAKAKLDEAKEHLIELADGKKSRIGDLLIYPINKKGRVSYADIVKEKLPNEDLSSYTSDSSTSWGVK